MIPCAPRFGGAVFFRNHPSMTPQDFIHARSRRHRSRGRARAPRPHPAQNRRGRREAKDLHVDQSLQRAPYLAGRRPRRTRPRGGFRLWVAGGYLDRGRAGEIAGAQSGAGGEAMRSYGQMLLVVGPSSDPAAPGHLLPQVGEGSARAICVTEVEPRRARSSPTCGRRQPHEVGSDEGRRARSTNRGDPLQ